MKVETKNLIGRALDWAVAICENVEVDEDFNPMWFDDYGKLVTYSPHIDWSQGEPIIERYQLDIEWVTANRCRVSYDWLDEEFYEGFGLTPLIAAMRCHVASKFGDEVEVPDELIGA